MNHSMPPAGWAMGKFVLISAQKTSPGRVTAHQKACTGVFGYGTVFDSHPDGCILTNELQPARGQGLPTGQTTSRKAHVPEKPDSTPPQPGEPGRPADPDHVPPTPPDEPAPVPVQDPPAEPVTPPYVVAY